MMRLLHAPEKIPLLTEILLVAVLAWMVSGWLLPASTVKLSGLAPTTGVSTVSLPNLAKLVTVPLFGKILTPARAIRPVAQQAKPVVISPLSIKLLGTVVAQEHGAAIIALSQGREQRVFFIGDTIQPGVILKTVEAEAIVVERNGMLERISLEQGSKLISSALPLRTTMGRAAVPVAASVSPSTAISAPAQATRKSMDRNQFRKQLQNFPALLSQARVIPHIVQGKAAGFTISDIVPGSLYQQAGLQNGDIILSVNGKQITGAKQAMGMYQTLQSATAIDLELVRAGQARRIHYEIR